jgi:hypothetical protein
MQHPLTEAIPQTSKLQLLMAYVAEQSGGKLTVDSGAGRGTTFATVLPLYDINDSIG